MFALSNFESFNTHDSRVALGAAVKKLLESKDAKVMALPAMPVAPKRTPFEGAMVRLMFAVQTNLSNGLLPAHAALRAIVWAESRVLPTLSGEHKAAFIAVLNTERSRAQQADRERMLSLRKPEVPVMNEKVIGQAYAGSNDKLRTARDLIKRIGQNPRFSQDERERFFAAIADGVQTHFRKDVHSILEIEAKAEASTAWMKRELRPFLPRPVPQHKPRSSNGAPRQFFAPTVGMSDAPRAPKVVEVQNLTPDEQAKRTAERAEERRQRNLRSQEASRSLPTSLIEKPGDSRRHAKVRASQKSAKDKGGDKTGGKGKK